MTFFAHSIVIISFKFLFVDRLCPTATLNDENFANFVRKHFPAALKMSANPKGLLFLQDGDLTQNSRKVKKAFDDVECRMFRFRPGLQI